MNQEKKEGLPDISELKSPKNIFFMIVAVIVVIGIIGFSHFTEDEKKPSSSTEETYAVQQDVKGEAKKIEVSNTEETHQQISQTNSEQVNPEIIKQQIALIQEKQKVLQQRLTAPLMVVNTNHQQSDVTNNNQKNKLISADENSQFMQQVSAKNAESVTAISIGHLNTVIAEGSLIHATLESAINSDLPGYVRASVSVPVYAEDGSQILIPPGSRLIGQYKSSLLQGQTRIFIVWTRLITPSGMAIQLGSPGVDNLGVAGMDADEINRHFWERFGTASLLSLIGTGANNIGVNAGDQNNSTAMYREAVASSFAQSADQSLQQSGRMAPTLKKYQGEPIIVFVAKDLHFDQALQQVKPHINVF